MESYRIVAIGDVIVSTALLTERFVCDINTCKGQCCVEGESGAPVEIEEVELLLREYESFAPFMTKKGREAVEQQDVAVLDVDGEWVTPLIDGAECVYAQFNKDGICKCVIEYAFHEGKTSFRKPISCWLYPIRIQKLFAGVALNYHRWHVCMGACALGQEEGIPVYRFLKEPLIAKFGKEFYEQLDAAAGLLPQ